MNAPMMLAGKELEAFRRAHRCDWCGAEPGERCAGDDDLPLPRSHASRGKVPTRVTRVDGTRRRKAATAQKLYRLRRSNDRLRRQLRAERDEVQRLHKLLLRAQAALGGAT